MNDAPAVTSVESSSRPRAAGPGLSIHGLTKSYRDAEISLTVLDNLTHQFAPGLRTAILGSSGVGKSTLLQLLGGLDRPTTGSVRFGEVIVSELDSDELAHFRARHIGFIFQFHHLLPEFSALENVAMPLSVAGMRDELALPEAKRLLDRVGLSHRERHRPGQLSGGEQQRVAIARALVAKPSIVLADEPTGNLDAKTAAQVQELLFETVREAGSSLIVVTHNQDLARAMDEVLEMLPGGRLVARRLDP